MNLALYQQAIKDWARAAHGKGRLDAPDGEATLDNTLCGDRVHIQVRLENGRIARLAHETRGCLLCEASASLIAHRAAGLAPAAVQDIADAARDLLAATPAPDPPWPELDIFLPARDVPSRHKCILLPFRALLAALDAAKIGAGGAAPSTGSPP